MPWRKEGERPVSDVRGISLVMIGDAAACLNGQTRPAMSGRASSIALRPGVSVAGCECLYVRTSAYGAGPTFTMRELPGLYTSAGVQPPVREPSAPTASSRGFPSRARSQSHLRERRTRTWWTFGWMSFG